MLRLENVLTVTLLLGALLIVSGERVRYDNHHVYQLRPRSVEDLAAIKALESARDAYVFLDAVHYVNSKIHVVVAPARVPAFIARLQKARIPYELVEKNAQSQLEHDEVADANRRNSVYTWDQYHELNDTYNWLHSLAAQYPKQVSTFVAGQTYEGRDILGVRIAFGKPNRKVIFLEGGMHAREWISPAVTTYITNQLLNSTNKDVRLIAESFDWYIVPHANPDGFVYTFTDRLWRKTRTPYENGCFGADPNRNWDFHWNEVGASSEPCSDTYAGPKAFSEVETRTFSQFISTLKGQIFLYISFHSYSQLLLFPYGHTNELPPNYADLKRVFDAAIKAVGNRYGTKYTGGNVYDAIYPAAGASLDWAYGVNAVKYSYCYELRPSSLNFWTGFRLPAAQIVPTAEETLDSLLEMVKEAGIPSFV